VPCRTHSASLQLRIVRLLQRSYGLVRFVKEESLSSSLVPRLDQLAELLFLSLTHRRPRELLRQSCLDKHERFVCIVLRQRQHVSRTRYFSPRRRIVASPAVVRTHWSESFIFRSLTLLSSRESTSLAVSMSEPFSELRDKE